MHTKRASICVPTEPSLAALVVAILKWYAASTLKKAFALLARLEICLIDLDGEVIYLSQESCSCLASFAIRLLSVVWWQLEELLQDVVLTLLLRFRL